MGYEGSPAHQATELAASRSARPGPTRSKTSTIDYEKYAARWAAMGRPDRAASLYAIALERDPDNWPLRRQLAACLANSGQPRAAARQYLVLARSYVTQRFSSDALELGRWILELDPCEFSHDNIADIALAIGSAAVPLCRRAARMHREAGRNNRAADLLLLCGRLDPHDIEPWRELGQLYFEYQMNSEAAWALRQAGVLLLEAGDRHRYVDFAYTILWLEPDDLETRHKLSQVLVEIGPPQEAAVERPSRPPSVTVPVTDDHCSITGMVVRSSAGQVPDAVSFEPRYEEDGGILDATNLVESLESLETSKPVPLIKTSELVQSVQLVEPAHSALPVEPTHSVLPVEPTHSVPPVEPTHSVLPVEPTHSVPPVEPTHSVELDELDESVELVELVELELVEPEGSLQLVEPSSVTPDETDLWFVDLVAS